MKINKTFLYYLSIIILMNFVIEMNADSYNPDPPPSTVKLIFIHHSCGENWLNDSNGGLGIALMNNNYFVSDTNYGWGPDNIGDRTDIGYWWTWFRGVNSTTYLNSLYYESDKSWNFYSRLNSDPGGENEIIMFKSCYPNSYLGGNADDSPTTGDNPLRGQDCWSGYHNVANAKGIYNDILTYFSAHQDKLFVVVTAPPQVDGETDSKHAANARAFNDWLINEWLKNYEYHNVAVFDFYNVLTSNGGDRYTNDEGWVMGNHHRYWDGDVQHQKTEDKNTSAYASSDYDSHPTYAGNEKATSEFIELLNIYFHCWKGTGDCPGGGNSNQSPVIDSFSADPQSGNAPLTVSFSCIAHDPDGNIIKYMWDFDGDGSIDRTTTRNCVIYIYEKTGKYITKCTVEDNMGKMITSNPVGIAVDIKKKGSAKR